MDFGDILDEWEKDTSRAYGKKRIKEDEKKASCSADKGEAGTEEVRANPIDIWLRRYGAVNKDEFLEEREETAAERRSRLRTMKSEAVIDLHGLTREEAWARLEAFFADAVSRKLSKVLIIHGKGSHSEGDPVLARMVRLFIEQNRHAGESGHPGNESGGKGSTWVIIK